MGQGLLKILKYNNKKHGRLIVTFKFKILLAQGGEEQQQEPQLVKG